MASSGVEIAMKHGRVAIVSQEDADLAAQKWYASPAGEALYYAKQAYRGPNGERRWRSLHNVIAERMGIRGTPDHANRNGLDNRRHNLRPATNQQNGANHGLSVANTSGYKGVSWCRREGKWRAYIRVNYQRKSLGYHATAVAAAMVYDKAAVAAFGDFAVLNFDAGRPLNPGGAR